MELESIMFKMDDDNDDLSDIYNDDDDDELLNIINNQLRQGVMNDTEKNYISKLNI